MNLMTRRSELLGLTEQGASERLEYVLKSLSLPTTVNIPDEILTAQMYKDKRITEGKIQLTLLKRIGEGFSTPYPSKNFQGT